MTMSSSIAPPPPGAVHSAPNTAPPRQGGGRPPSGPVMTLTPKRKSFGERFSDAIDRFVDRFRDASEALRDPAAMQWVHDFADAVTMARDPEQVEATLVRLAGAVANASRVELLLDRDVAAQASPKLVSLWPEGAENMTADEVSTASLTPAA